MAGLALRCSNLRLWSSHQASPFSSLSGPAHPSRLSLLSHPPASRLPSAASRSLPCPSRPPSFLAFLMFLCLLGVSLFSGFTHWVPGAPIKSETRPRVQHILDMPSPPLTCTISRPRQFQDPEGSELPIKVPLPGLSLSLSLFVFCQLPKLKCHGKSKCRLSQSYYVRQCQ